MKCFAGPWGVFDQWKCWPHFKNSTRPTNLQLVEKSIEFCRSITWWIHQSPIWIETNTKTKRSSGESIYWTFSVCTYGNHVIQMIFSSRLCKNAFSSLFFFIDNVTEFFWWWEIEYSIEKQTSCNETPTYWTRGKYIVWWWSKRNGWNVEEHSCEQRKYGCDQEYASINAKISHTNAAKWGIIPSRVFSILLGVTWIGKHKHYILTFRIV